MRRRRARRWKGRRRRKRRRCEWRRSVQWPETTAQAMISRIRKRLWIEHADAISAVAAAGDHLYSVSWDKTLKIWSTTRLRCLEFVAAHEDAVNAVAVADDGTVYTGLADRRIRVWAIPARVKRHELVATLDRHRSTVHALALSSNGSLLYSGACDRARERAHNRDLRPYPSIAAGVAKPKGRWGKGSPLG
ncbi:Zinc finger CCCH domain-containing protein 62 [Apostasia shenzhenica]|uniref:Zinc finger CCCH domain-containing protein 62 n=1 Tax=Apostasia shenzhenica TaxID=1088818 RepID=A0A2I0AWF2_9ASPA|nr:Zinc finger CCCH domain-containing protein 62 [Apostasia shenzhenica]